MADKNNVCWPGWENVRQIGKGSFGTVYEIQRNVFDSVEKAALKVISIPQNEGDIDELYSEGYDGETITSAYQNHLKSIVTEYSMMRKMNGSSHIVSCDDVRYVQHDDGIGWDIFIKMELLTPLTKALPMDIPEETVIHVARDMCAALELCQKHEIVHRDIKPQNIFLSPNGDYKLGDFGIAKTVEKTMGGTKIGTYKYMAPEVYHNQPYGAAADIYSLGLVLYWMLNERRMPFVPLPPVKMTAEMNEQARHRRLSGEQLLPPAHGSNALKGIVMKACAYNPKQRFTCAQEMLQALNMHDGISEETTDTIIQSHTATAERTAYAVVGQDLNATEYAGKNNHITSRVTAETTAERVKNAGDGKTTDKKPIIKWCVAAAVCVLLLAIAFWPVYGSWSQWQMNEPTADRIKVETAPWYRAREKTILITESEHGVNGTLLNHWEDWSDYSPWTAWQLEPIEENDACQVERELHYRKRSISTKVVYGEWSDWGKWGIEVPTESDTLEAASRVVYVYNGYHYYCHTCGRSSAAVASKCVSHNVQYKTKIMYGLNTELKVNTRTTPYSMSYDGETWYVSSSTFDMRAIQYQTRTRDKTEETTYGDWSEYTKTPITANEQTEVESVDRYRCRTREWITKYEYEVWGDWSDWQPVSMQGGEDVQVEQCNFYRYANKYFLWEKVLGRVQ